MLPDTYSVPVTKVQRVNTNQRYSHFKQIHFTAGDEDQFIHHTKQVKSCIKTFLECPVPLVSPKLLITGATTMDTFRYMFYKFKKGVLVQVRNGRLATFLPFSNVHYRNEWWRSVNTSANFPPNSLPVEEWYSNNGLMRHESPCNETDTGMCHLKHMFETLCKQRSVPDVDVFVNKRDFPLLKEDGTEPYESLWGEGVELQSHAYAHYTPVLGMTTSDGFLDIPIPTCEDWNRVMLKQGVHFAQTSHVLPVEQPFPSEWRTKKDKCVFRGSSTGLGTCAATNPRLKLVHLYKNHPLFNVGITNNNTKVRKLKDSCFLQVPKQVALAEPLSLLEQSTYKYVLHLPGHSQAYRLVIELAMNVVVLLVECKYRIWIEHYMVPWEHYVPVKGDLSDLVAQVQWCTNHPDECQTIAKNARKLYDQRCSSASTLLDELANTISSIHASCVRVDHPPSSAETFKEPNHVERPVPSVAKRTWKELVHHPLNSNPKRLRFIKKFQLGSNAVLSTRHDGHTCIVRPYDPTVYTMGRGVFNQLLRYAPNFSYTFRRQTDTSLFLQESIPGQSMAEWIKSPGFTFEAWVDVFLQCVAALAVAQNRALVSLCNCTAWNVRLVKTGGTTTNSVDYSVDYSVDVGVVVRVVSPSLTPVFTSYDDAVCVMGTQVLGHGHRPFNASIDVKSLLGSCMHVMKGARVQVDRSFLSFLSTSVFDTVAPPDLSRGYYYIPGGPSPHSLIRRVLGHRQTKGVFLVPLWEHHNTGMVLKSTPMFSKSSHPILNSYKYKLMNVPYTSNSEHELVLSLPSLVRDFVDMTKTVVLTPAYLSFLAAILDIVNSDIVSDSTRDQLLKQYQSLTGAQGVEGPWREQMIKVCRRRYESCSN